MKSFKQLSQRGYSIIKQKGLRNFLARTIWRFIYKIPGIRSILERYILKGDLQSRFIAIHKTNYWNSLESVSGSGSTLKATENLRAKLPDLIKRFGIESLCDAPCGDFSWIRDVILDLDIVYKGVDVVPDLITSLQNFANERITFECGDIRTHDFNKFDLMLIRDCLFHLSYKDIDLVLKNLSQQNYKYLLTTSYLPDSTFINVDIETGGFRHIDLLSAPFNFPNNYTTSIADWLEPESIRYLYMWEKNQVPTALKFPA